MLTTGVDSDFGLSEGATVELIALAYKHRDVPPPPHPRKKHPIYIVVSMDTY